MRRLPGLPLRDELAFAAPSKNGEVGDEADLGQN